MNYDPSRFTGAKEETPVIEMPTKSSGWGKTDWVIPRSTFNAQNHDWVQRGYEIRCSSCKITHASYLPVGKMLVGQRGEWEVIDEPRG